MLTRAESGNAAMQTHAAAVTCIELGHAAVHVQRRAEAASAATVPEPGSARGHQATHAWHKGQRCEGALFFSKVIEVGKGRGRLLRLRRLLGPSAIFNFDDRHPRRVVNDGTKNNEYGFY